MARRRASMREGPLAELFRATEAAQRGGAEPDATQPAEAAPSNPSPTPAEPEERRYEPLEETVELLDVDAAKIALVNSGRMPFIEKSADEVLRSVIGKTLRATLDNSCLHDADAAVAVLGTPVYMPPEQAKGHAADRRSELVRPKNSGPSRM